MNKFKFYTILIFFCSPFILSAQTTDTTGFNASYQAGRRLIAEGRATEGTELLDRLAKGYEKARDTSRQVMCLLDLGSFYLSVSQYEKSDQYFQKALGPASHAKRLVPCDLLVTLYIEYGCLLKEREYKIEAFAIYEEALTIARRNAPDNYKYIGRIYSHIARLHLLNDQAEEALKYLKMSEEAYAHTDADMEELYLTYYNLSLAHYHTFNYDKSSFYQQKLLHWLDALPEIPRNVQADLIYLFSGDLMASDNRVTEALDYHYKAISFIESRYGSYKRTGAITWEQIGLDYISLARYQEALDAFHKAQIISDSIWKTPCEIRYRLLASMAEIIMMQGDLQLADQYWEKAITESRRMEGAWQLIDITGRRMSKALDMKQYEQCIHYAQEAIRLLKEDPRYSLANLSNCYVGMGAALFYLGRYKEAEVSFDEALKRQCLSDATFDAAGFPPDSAIPVSYLTLDVAYWKAIVCAKQWDQNKSALQMLEKAEIAARQALRFATALQQRYRQSGSKNFENEANYNKVFDINIAVARRLYDHRQDPRYLAAAFQFADKSRAVSLGESTRRVEAKQFAGISADILEEEARLNSQVALCERQTFDALQEHNTEKVRYYRDTLLFGLKRAQQQFALRLERDYPRYYQLSRTQPDIDVEALRARLDEHTALIEYSINEEEKTLSIFYLEKDKGLRLIVVPWQEDAGKNIRELNNLIQAVWLQRADKRARFVALSHSLYLQLIQPVGELLAGKSRLVIVAESDLHYLPFELLVEKPALQSFDQLPYLLRRFDISYQHSAYFYLNALKKRQKTADIPTSLLAFAPVFGDTDAPPIAALSNQNLRDTTLHAFTYDGKFTPLYYSAREVTAIAELFGENRSHVLLYEAANEETLKAELRRPRQIVHLASHSFANMEYPKFSGIGCAQPKKATSSGEDGILYTNEIYNLDIPADLVVLSSCESGAGRLNDGDGVLGLNRAFSYAGVPNIIYSLWKVNDKATSELMVAFYKEILAGKPYAAALRAAKLKMLQNPATASPNFWSGFLLMGR